MPKQSSWQKFVHDHAGKGMTMQQMSKLYQQQKKDVSPNYKGIAVNLLEERAELKRRLAVAEREREVLKGQVQLCNEYMRKSTAPSSVKKRITA